MRETLKTGKGPEARREGSPRPPFGIGDGGIAEGLGVSTRRTLVLQGRLVRRRGDSLLFWTSARSNGSAKLTGKPLLEHDIPFGPKVREGETGPPSGPLDQRHLADGFKNFLERVPAGKDETSAQLSEGSSDVHQGWAIGKKVEEMSILWNSSFQ